MSESKPDTERRGSQRRPVLDSFSLFVVVPKKGGSRLKIHDLSERGLGCDIDVEGEDPDFFPIKKGEQLHIRLYLNQTLHVPVDVTVVRVIDGSGVRRVGLEYSDSAGSGAKACAAFVRMLDNILDVVKLDTLPQI